MVSRRFGGTKLGTGGLTRAYAEAARGAVAAAGLERVTVHRVLEVGFEYDLTAPVERVAARHGARTVGAEYGVRVELRLAVPEEEAEALAAALSEATADRASIRLGSSRFPA